MKLLTINVGLLDYKLFGATLFSNPPYSTERIKFIPDEILKFDADIVAIQECYYEKHVKFLFDALKHKYPFMARKEGRNFYTLLNLHNGLLIFSKYEVIGVDIISHKKVAPVEYYFGDKSTLVANIIFPEIGNISIINTHPTAGGSEPESGEADLGRQFALNQTIDAAKKCKANGSVPILIGDFNCAPDCSAPNYEQIINSGYRDCFSEAEEKNILPDGCLKYTWDPENVLNKGGVHGHCPPQRVDHVFLPKDEPCFGEVKSCNIVLTEKIVDIPKGRKCSISDHYGLVVEIDISPSVGKSAI
eukprot:gene6947-9501_t